jgi:hypothetical protein
LLLHFGLEPKFYRVVDLRAGRVAQPNAHSDGCQSSNASNGVSEADESHRRGYADTPERSEASDRSSMEKAPNATSPDDDL